MKIEIKVPPMGESISEATIGTILKPAGTRVAADDELIELETDKVNQILYAPAAGVISWEVKPEDVVKIDQVLGSIDTSKEAQPTPKPAVASPAEQQAKAGPSAVPKETTAPIAEVSSATDKKSQSKEAPLQALSTHGARSSKEAFIAELSTSAPQTPPAAQTPPKPFAKEIPQALQTPSPTSPSPVSERIETRKKMSKIRKVISQRLVEVLQQTAMLTTFNEVDMSAIISLRELYKEPFTKLHKTKLGFMSFFVKASVAALKAFPEVNAYIDGEEVVYREYFDIGVAVGTEKGVFVPVIRNCNVLSFAGIERSLEDFAKKAREGGLSVGDLQGGSFTITNGGIYGSLLSTPILNPPQSAILGMHKIQKRAVVINEQVVVRPMMYLALSYDHRIIDGKEAVSFLVHIKNNLEDPTRLLLDV